MSQFSVSSTSLGLTRTSHSSPLQQRMSALANSPRIPPAAVPCRPPARRRRSVESGPITLAPDSDAIDYDDSGYLTGAGVEDKVDVVMDGESASDEDENDELLEMASQIMQTGTSKEKKRFLARLRRGAVAGVGSSDNGEADDEGATEAIEMVSSVSVSAASRHANISALPKLGRSGSQNPCARRRTPRSRRASLPCRRSRPRAASARPLLTNQGVPASSPS